MEPKENNMETVDLDNVAIFSTGIWEGKGSAQGGDHITEKYLDSLVKTYSEIGDKVKPRMILTHDGKKSEGITGTAAIGWIKNLRRDGKNLVADIKSVPKKIASLINAKAFGRFSPGIWNKMNVNGEIYENVIDHLALLGADIPANLDLHGFIDLYENNMNGEEIIHYTNKVDNMDKEIQDLENKIKTYEMKIEELNSEIAEKAELEKKNAELRDRLAKVEFEKAESEVDNYLNGQVKDEKITPAQAVEFKKLMMGETKEDKGNVKEFSAKMDIIKNIIDSTPKAENKSKSEHVEPPKPELDEKTNYEKQGEDLYEKAVKYMKENNIEDNYENYKNALRIVSMEA